MIHNIPEINFEGPIALLHEMIEARKLSISQVSLVTITEDFLKFVRENENNLSKDDITHFIFIASILILIKSKSLIPELELTEEEDRDILILENQLKSFELIKQKTKTIQQRWFKKASITPYLKTQKLGDIFVPEPKMDIDYLLPYIRQRILEIEPKEDDKKEIKVHKTLKIEDALNHVRVIIKRIKNLSFKELNHDGDERLKEKNKRNIVILFLAVLELVKIGEIDANQEGNFSDILILENN